MTTLLTAWTMKEREEPMVRCKFKLNSVTHRKEYNGRDVYDAKFNVVYSDDPTSENKRFWDATPSGEFSVSTIKELPWELGREYYLDITPA